MANKKKANNWPTWSKSINGTMDIFGNEFRGKKGKKWTKWSTQLGVQDDDGDWQNCYIDVKFKKDEAPEGKGLNRIDINEAFMTAECYSSADGEIITKPVIVVMDYDVVETEKASKPKKVKKSKKAEVEDTDDDDIPF